jgi:hypothetical protein
MEHKQDLSFAACQVHWCNWIKQVMNG